MGWLPLPVILLAAWPEMTAVAVDAAEVDAALTAGTGLPDGVTGDVGGELTYTVEIDKTRNLSVTLDTSGARYRIVAWVVEPAGEWVADSELDLY